MQVPNEMAFSNVHVGINVKKTTSCGVLGTSGRPVKYLLFRTDSAECELKSNNKPSFFYPRTQAF